MKTIEYKPTGYESDLTDAQWDKIAKFFPTGNKSKTHKRSFAGAALYLVKTGCNGGDFRTTTRIGVR
jgi:hypothetical protein